MQTLQVNRGVWLPTLFFVLSCAASCDSSGRSSEQVSIRYGGDASAYGISISAGAAAGAATAAQDESILCTMSPAAVAAGCTANIETSANSLSLSLYGCFAESGDHLFDCELSAELAEGLRSNATVNAGCGCQPSCPSDPSIILCAEGGSDCTLPEGLGPQRAEVVVTTAGSTEETTCSTCCETDFFDEEIATVVSDEAISEIEVIVRFAEECQFDVNGTADCNVEDDQDYWSEERSFGSTLVQRFCLAATHPAEGPISVPALSCKGIIIGVEVPRALGRDFTPVSTPPEIIFE